MNLSEKFTVVKDPLNMFEEGLEIDYKDLATWLEEENLPIGMVLYGNREWVVSHDGDQMVLETVINVSSKHIEAGLTDLSNGITRYIERNHRSGIKTSAKVLREFDKNTDATCADVSDILGVSRQAISFHTIQLEKMGVLRREGGPERKYMSKHIHVTGIGKKVIKEIFDE